jgi:LPLT family lysophospholipid transporter-like MFS transporter
MSRGLYALVGAQFLSAFADNAVLFTVIAIVLKDQNSPAWYVPALQSVFLIAYVALTPWVGDWSDRLPKPRVLVLANLVKALGGVLILVGVEPLIGYMVIGAGAAAYSPAKYGVLPELVDVDRLVKANSWIEGATIAAILTGTVAGSRLADHSITLGLSVSIGIFLVSAAAMLFMPKLPARGAAPGSPLGKLLGLMRGLLASQRARLVLLALSLFWACAATLRVVLVAWAPAVLGTRTTSDIADLTVFLAIGIVIGSAVVPKLIPLDQVRRVRWAAWALGGTFLLLAGVASPWPARGALLGIGVAGGMLVVPLNAAIQQIGHRTIGSGSAVAVQNFFQNAAMLGGVGLYGLAADHGTGPVAAILILSGVVWAMTVLVSWRLPKQPAV